MVGWNDQVMGLYGCLDGAVQWADASGIRLTHERASCSDTCDHALLAWCTIEGGWETGVGGWWGPYMGR